MCVREVHRNLLGIHGSIAALHHCRIRDIEIVGYTSVFFSHKVKMGQIALEFISFADITARKAPVKVFGRLIGVASF